MSPVALEIAKIGPYIHLFVIKGRRPLTHHQQSTISQKRRKIGRKLLLLTHRKSHMGFLLGPKLVTLNDLERRNGYYIALFLGIR